MRSLQQINRLNQKAAIAKEQFLARALNNPKGRPADFVEPSPDALPDETLGPIGSQGGGGDPGQQGA